MPMAKTRLGQIMIALALRSMALVSALQRRFRRLMPSRWASSILRRSWKNRKSGKKALDGLKEYVSTRQKLLSRDEEELRNTEKTLKESTSKLSEAEKKEKEAQFRTKIQEYQKRAQEFNQELQGKQKELVDDYMKRIAIGDSDGGRKRRLLDRRR